MVTATDIVNQAVQLIGDNQPPVTGSLPNFDASPAGVAAARLYTPCVQTVARQFAWDFARSVKPLVLSGNAAPLLWAYEYRYPADGVQIWQLLPGTLADPNNPLPVNWDVGNVLVTGVQTKVIWTNQQSATAVYNNAADENTWDPIFREAVVRLLASEMAAAIPARPDTEAAMLQSGAAFESLGEGRPD